MRDFMLHLQNDARKRMTFALLFSLAGFALNFIAFYPGIMSPDSFDQYRQALNNKYGDWHPPVMAAFWHLLLKLHKGPQPMLLFQLALLWGSFYVLLSSFLKHFGYWCLLVVLVFFAPFVQNFPGNIWKDMHMALSWLFAASLLVNAFLDQRKLKLWESLICMLFICYGCWVRLSGFPGIIPLLFMWWMLTLRNPGFTKAPVSAVAAILLTFGVLRLEAFISKNLLHAGKDHIEYKLIAHDLTGISVKSGKLCFPDYITTSPGFDTTYLLSRYTPVTFDYIWWNNDNKRIMPEISPDQISHIKKYWIRTILEHPLIYLKIKAKGYLYFLRIRNSGSPITVIYPETYPNEFGITFRQNLLSRLIIAPIEKQINAPYMRPWFWLLLSFGLLFLVFLKMFRPQRMLLLCLALSSLFYFGIHFFVYPADTEFRYFYWPCLCVSLGWILCIALWRSKKTSTENAAPSSETVSA